ncbi:hypothetical protein PV10_00774 [Exophiala mesophila]|uniref:Lipocalin/cytosolic fatty-acid binding domain-containing protein n=1 Tax=Exophiala mesophila TaxID=212818 RepID=A0A0D1ZSU6_EXOME|nr:uncharacterized protein PV10_00774 [Exophiala mesophila]KIV96964.1 hypothetical protein PV10_00774 [Exophiala mesophila]
MISKAFPDITMHVSLLVAGLAIGASASPVLKRQDVGESTDSRLRTVDALWDGQCFYPESDDDFDLEDYLGRWYQVAGTVAPFTEGCTCIFAEYSLNEENNTVNVFNGCQLGDQNIEIRGNAAPADEVYGDEGVFLVQFPGQPPPECPGPNYIVQEFDDDDENWAIVQSSNFTTLFLLSRDQHPSDSDIENWLERAGRMGSNLTEVVRTNQTGCLFT